MVCQTGAKAGEVFQSNVTKTLPDGTEYGGVAEVGIDKYRMLMDTPLFTQ